MIRCLLTGGAGFVGSNLVDELLRLGHIVSIVDDFSTGNKDNVDFKGIKDSGGIFYQTSICDEEHLDFIFSQGKFDVVFHLAAWARVPRSIEDPVGTHGVNVNGTLLVFDMARKYKVGRVIYSSSSSVYGDKSVAEMNEGMETNPKSPYALHKLIGEKYASMYARLFKMNFFSLRYFNVYGKRQITEGAYSLVIGKFLEQKKKGEKMTVYGDGEQTRAYTHISDVVRANILAMEKDIPFTDMYQNFIYNVGSGVETSVNRIAELIGGEVQHITPNPRGEFEERRKCADWSKINKDLGWKPEVSIEEGIRMLLNDES